MTDLDKLIEVVEGGTLQDNPYFGMPMITACYPKDDRGFLVTDKWSDRNVMDAYHGSLDAAKALHEALLPDDYWINWFDLDGIVQIKNSVDDAFDGKAVPNPARAWLTAILKAYRSLQ